MAIYDFERTLVMTNKHTDALETILPKFMKQRDGGTSTRTLDEKFGLPETYIVSLLWEERQIVEDLIRAALSPVDVKILEVLHQHSKLTCGDYNYQCGFLDCLALAKELLRDHLSQRGVLR